MHPEAHDAVDDGHGDMPRLPGAVSNHGGPDGHVEQRDDRGGGPYVVRLECRVHYPPKDEHPEQRAALNDAVREGQAPEQALHLHHGALVALVPGWEVAEHEHGHMSQHVEVVDDPDVRDESPFGGLDQPERGPAAEELYDGVGDMDPQVA